MKNVVLFLFVTKILTFSLMAHGADSLVYVKGYYVVECNKDEIQDSYVQKVRKMKNETPYSTYIDFTRSFYFVPTQVGYDTILLDKNSIHKEIAKHNYFNKDSIYFLPREIQYFKKYFKDVLNQKDDMIKEQCLFSDLERSYPYYLSRLSEDKIYKCVYIEGEALSKSFENIESNRVKMFLDSEIVNDNSVFFTVFFVMKIKKYTPFVCIPGLEPWYPYLDE